MSERKLNTFDRLLVQFDRAVKTVTAPAPPPVRPSPANRATDVELDNAQRRHAAGLMRVNHSGEICAQALYRGQALTARLPRVRDEMQRAAQEEADHLAWCEDRIRELGGRPSVLNPLWYTLSMGIGAGAGLISDKLSLGFVAATEDQVCAHLRDHLHLLPADDQRSREVVTQMLEDEEKHSSSALGAGGLRFPSPAKKLMTAISKVMTELSYRA